MAQIRHLPKKLNGLLFEVNKDTPFIQLLNTVANTAVPWLFLPAYRVILGSTSIIINLEYILACRDADATCAMVWGWIGEHFPDVIHTRPYADFICLDFIDEKIIDQTTEETEAEMPFLVDGTEHSVATLEPMLAGEDCQPIKDLFKDLELNPIEPNETDSDKQS